MNTTKIEVEQRGRKVILYEWAMQAAEEIARATHFTRMVQPGTDVQIYLAEIITEYADGST